MKKTTFCFTCIVVLLLSCKNSTNEQKNKQLVTAITGLQEQVNKKPDSAGLRLALVNAFDSAKNYKEAISQINILLKKDSLNYGFWFRKGQLLSTVGDTPAAIRSFTYAAKIYPAPDALLSLGNLYAETKNSEALKIAQAVMHLKLGREYNAHCYFISGVYFARVGKTTEALENFENCIKENYTYMEAYMEKGFIYYDAKKTEAALKIFIMAANINNTYADAYYWQAKCYEALNKKEDAVKNYQLAFKIDGQLKEAAQAIDRLK
ncbi:MAG: tetratricopeptide repeat protein [Sphingobacteriia bacterium]|nr:tetratricopeptide repeat protein [Sphingobacteriia bacterium]